MKPGWALLLFCAAFLDVRAGDAEPSSLTAVLTLRKPDASPECFDQSGIQAAVEARLGRAVFVGESSADVRLELTFSVQPGGGWRAELMLSSRGGRFLGSRELSTRAEHCSALDDSLALVIALLLDIPRERAEDAPPAPPSAPSEPHPTPLKLPPDTYAPRKPWHVEPALFATWSPLGLLPGGALGVGLRLGIIPPVAIPLELEAGWWLPETVYAEELGRTAHADFQLAAFALFLCPLDANVAPWRGRACLGQRIGRLGVRAYGFDRNQPNRARVVYNLVIRAEGGITLTPWLWVGLGAATEVPLVRDEFVYKVAAGQSNEMFRMAVVIPSAELSVGLRW